MTNAEARVNNSLRPRKPEGSLGRTAQDVHLDSHTAPGLCGSGVVADRSYIALFSDLEQTHGARMWFYMSDWLFKARFLEYPPKWCTYSAGMASAT